MRIVFVMVGGLALGGCSPSPPPAQDKPPPTPPPVVAEAAPTDPPDLTRPCLPASLADASVAYLRTDGPRVTACYGNGDDSPGSVTHCLVLNELGEVVGPRAWADADRARVGERELPQAIDVEVDEGVVKPGVATYDRTRAFVFVEVADRYRGRFYDLRTDKLIGDVDLAALAPAAGVFTRADRVREARWVGTRVIVEDREEGGPAGQAFLLASSGDHVPLGSSYTVLDADLVATTTGKQIVLVDPGLLREVATFLVPGNSSPVGDLRITRFGDQLVVAFARPAGVFFIDRATRLTIHERDIPACR